MSLDRYLQRGKVNGARKGLFTLSVTLAFNLASEQVPKQERVSHDRMGKMAAERHRVGLERPHFFGFHPPKKFMGSLPPVAQEA